MNTTPTTTCIGATLLAASLSVGASCAAVAHEETLNTSAVVSTQSEGTIYDYAHLIGDSIHSPSVRSQCHIDYALGETERECARVTEAEGFPRGELWVSLVHAVEDPETVEAVRAEFVGVRVDDVSRVARFLLASDESPCTPSAWSMTGLLMSCGTFAVMLDTRYSASGLTSLMIVDSREATHLGRWMNSDGCGDNQWCSQWQEALIDTQPTPE